MTPAFVVAILWGLFAGTHIGLAAIRERLVARIGELGFVALFYAVAAATFAALVTYYAGHRFDGAAGLALGRVLALRWLLMVLAVLGIVLSAVALSVYTRLPSALFSHRVHRVRGIERVTRHPFFAGMALLAVAHALLAPHFVGTVFFTGLLLLATLGAWHQDRKLLRARGRAYAEYLTTTSAVPFVAIVARRQVLAWRELPMRALAGGLVLALAAARWHDALFARGGWPMVALVLGGAIIAGVNARRRARRFAAAHAAPSGDALAELSGAPASGP